MRNFDCDSFINTNFKKKLPVTSFVSKSVWGNPAMKVKVITKIRWHTAGAEAVTVLWMTVMNEHWGTK